MGSNGEPAAGPPEPKPASKTPKLDSESQTANDEKDRDRSPRKKQKGAACCYGWYTCLAAVLAMETGQSFDKVKNDLRARAKMVSHDLFMHVSKHAAEYKQFEPDKRTTVDMEAGSSPQSLDEVLEAGL